jgi:hypothetical protein
MKTKVYFSQAKTIFRLQVMESSQKWEGGSLVAVLQVVTGSSVLWKSVWYQLLGCSWIMRGLW